MMLEQYKAHKDRLPISNGHLVGRGLLQWMDGSEKGGNEIPLTTGFLVDEKIVS